MERCFNFKEHPDWQHKHPTGPVTWDGFCSECGFRLEDRPWANGTAIEGGGRRLAFVGDKLTVGVDVFYSAERYIACSECVPKLLEKQKD